MKGLQIWAFSNCRSVLSFYEELGRAFGVSLRIIVLNRESSRTGIGWSEHEFNHLNLTFLDDDDSKAKKELRTHLDWHQLFASYQNCSLYRELIPLARSLGCSVAIGSEAPCNSTPPPKRMLKELFLQYVLPLKVRRQVDAADFMLNYSGDETCRVRRIGWKSEQIVPCGYFPAPLPGSVFVERTEKHWQHFRVLMTGALCWHRAPDVLIDALILLKNWGVNCETVITQKGPLFESLKRKANSHQLRLDFAGLVSPRDLLDLYHNCSCFVAAGRDEPWGIRINDALHCGAPLVVSRGMGGGKIVHDYGCGATFGRDDPVDLANQILRLITNRDDYLSVAMRCRKASKSCQPKVVANAIANIIRSRFAGW